MQQKNKMYEQMPELGQLSNKKSFKDFLKEFRDGFVLISSGREFHNFGP
jgi:hypothetical protein